jgi:hypothetical protein
MQRYRLERVYLPTETLGSIYGPVTGDEKGPVICKTMELPWKDNAKNVSCVPEGVYVLKKMAPGFGRDYGYFRFMHVSGRNINHVLGMSTILIHRITYVKDLAGCIGVGGRHVDLNKDGVPDMIDSGKKLQWMYENLPAEFELEITKKLV